MSRPLSSESVFRAIADPTRRRMLDVLRNGDRAVADLLMPFRLKNPLASYHLRVLREAGLVRQRREGLQRVYSLQRRVLQDATVWLKKFDED